MQKAKSKKIKVERELKYKAPAQLLKDVVKHTKQYGALRIFCATADVHPTTVRNFIRDKKTTASIQYKLESAVSKFKEEPVTV